MALASYSDLVAAIGDWLDRDDLVSRVPTFIAMVEAKLNRRLDDPEQDVTTSIVASGEFTALPADFGGMVSINAGLGDLKQIGAVEYAGYNPAVTGIPRRYAIVDGAIAFGPRNSTAVIRLVYRRTIPALTATNTVNWLLTRAPDVYLYGALVEASAFLAEDSRAGSWKALFEQAVDEMMMDGNRRRWGSGPLAPRIMRP